MVWGKLNEYYMCAMTCALKLPTHGSTWSRASTWHHCNYWKPPHRRRNNTAVGICSATRQQRCYPRDYVTRQWDLVSSQLLQTPREILLYHTYHSRVSSTLTLLDWVGFMASDKSTWSLPSSSWACALPLEVTTTSIRVPERIHYHFSSENVSPKLER